MNLNLIAIETELKKRLKYPYQWKRKQNNSFDQSTNFIYTIHNFEEVLNEIKYRHSHKKDYDDYFQYALNRWYNFWSAKAIEQVFCSLPETQAAHNKYDKQKDFYIQNIPFDHKTSVFPKGFRNTIEYAQKHPKELIQWLYNNQSQQGRKHFKNRLFLLLYDRQNQKHWKLKSEIHWLQKIIQKDMSKFDAKNLISIYFSDDCVTKSTIIFAVK